jgi:hypothetical protein
MTAIAVGFPTPEPGVSALDAFRVASKSTRRLLQLKLVYVRYVADVDTLNQSFRTAFGLDMLWPATESDKANFQRDPKTFEPGYVPNFEFPNAKEVDLERRVLASGNAFKVTPDGFNFLRTLVTGTFMEKFELYNYPFDVQALTVIMDMSFDLKEEALFVPSFASYSLQSEHDPSDVNNFVQFNRAFSAIPDFVARRVITEFSVRDNCWGQMVMRIQMERRPEGTLGRIASMCSLLNASTLCVFAMDPVTDLGNRVSFLITLILAFVAFQFIISSSLPTTPYLTLMDQYTLASFMFLVLTMCIISIMGRVQFASLDAYHDADNMLFYIAASVDVAIQLLFIARSFHARRVELAKLDMDMNTLNATNKGPDDTPINVYGAGVLHESADTFTGDPVISFQGMAAVRPKKSNKLV